MHSSSSSSSQRTRRELAQQPEVLADLVTQRDAIRETAKLIDSRRPRHIFVAARGSSNNAAVYAQHVLGRFCRLPVTLAAPSLFTVYDTPPALEDAVVIGISQSGQSPDIVSVLVECQRQGCPTVAITNDARSPLATAADLIVDLHAGREDAVAATKTYTASLAVVAMLAAHLAGDRRLLDEVLLVPDAVATQLRLSGASAQEREFLGSRESWTFVGRGVSYATALEGALKMRELAGVQAEGLSSADLMHGPIASVSSRSVAVLIAPHGPTGKSMVDALARVDECGALTALLTDMQSPPAATINVQLASVPEWLAPIVSVVPLQLLAVEMSEQRGIDTDSPPGLQKVTRTT
jgi:glucosamine--fructose-6-phosphate aminotransferase (isomerizing)